MEYRKQTSLVDNLNYNYLKQIAFKSESDINDTFYFKKSGFTPFDIIHCSFINKTFSSTSNNLLITFPTKQKHTEIYKSIITSSVLENILSNLKLEFSPRLEDKVWSQGKICIVKKVADTHMDVLPIGTFTRINIEKKTSIILSDVINKKVEEVLRKNTLQKRTLGIKNFQFRIAEDFKKYSSLLKYYKEELTLPMRYRKKIVIISSRKDFLNSSLTGISYQFINKYGIRFPELSIDPIIIVASDFSIVKEHLINQSIEIEAIIFIGDNKYKSLTSVTKLYRQNKIGNCIFIGTKNVENTDLFKILKWNWTLPEIAYFSNQINSCINRIIIPNSELSECISNYVQTILSLEEQHDNIINLKKALRYARKINSITALDKERTRSRANIIFREFETEVQAIFEDEYNHIDINYKEDFEVLKSQYKKVIDIIKNNNSKSNWFKEREEDIDFIVVPKVIKNFWKKEIDKIFETKMIGKKVMNFSDLEMASIKFKNKIEYYKGLQNAEIITLSDFEQKPSDNKKYLFISIYGYGIYPEILLEKILAKDVISEILLYEEEDKVLQYYLQKHHTKNLTEFRSNDRNLLCGIPYIETQESSDYDIDDWLKYLLENDKHTEKGEEIKYEITFDGNLKKFKERESKTVYIEDDDEHHKEVQELKKGDKIRLYQNPDVEILHDIIKMTDEKELFTRVEKFSRLWKSSLKTYLNNHSDDVTALYSALKLNGLTVSINQLENWLNPDNKTKFPKRKIDIAAITKTTNDSELLSNWKHIMQTITEYSGTLNLKGRKFSDEIDNYILSGEKGEMLNWLSDTHIQRIVENGAPLQTIKEIKKLDYGVID